MPLLFPTILKSMERHKQSHTTYGSIYIENSLQNTTRIENNKKKLFGVDWSALRRISQIPSRSIKMLKHGASQWSQEGGEKRLLFSLSVLIWSCFSCRFFIVRYLFYTSKDSFLITSNEWWVLIVCASPKGRKEGKNSRSATLIPLIKKKG